MSIVSDLSMTSDLYIDQTKSKNVNGPLEVFRIEGLLLTHILNELDLTSVIVSK